MANKQIKSTTDLWSNILHICFMCFCWFSVRNLDFILDRMECLFDLFLFKCWRIESRKCNLPLSLVNLSIFSTSFSILFLFPSLVDAIPKQNNDILSLGTGAVSWFEVNGFGCVPTYSTNITSDDPSRMLRPEYVEGCLLEWYAVETVQSAVQLCLAVSIILSSSSSRQLNILKKERKEPRNEWKATRT